MKKQQDDFVLKLDMSPLHWHHLEKIVMSLPLNGMIEGFTQAISHDYFRYAYIRKKSSGLITRIQISTGGTFQSEAKELVMPDEHYENFRSLLGSDFADSTENVIKIVGSTLIKNTYWIFMRCEKIRKQSIISRIKYRRFV